MINKIEKILLIVIVSLPFFCFGQTPKNTSFINLGYDRIGSVNFVKGGYKIAFSQFGEYERDFSTLSTDIGYSSIDSDSYFAPSITYNFYGLFYYLGLNTTYFLGENKKDLRIAPQIGLTYFNIINIGYSYYSPLNYSSRIDVINNHSLNISLSIPVGGI